MDTNKLSELNRLFEKAVSNQANMDERQSLNSLYQDFIDDGRDTHNYNNRRTTAMKSQVQLLREKQKANRHVS